MHTPKPMSKYLHLAMSPPCSVSFHWALRAARPVPVLNPSGVVSATGVGRVGISLHVPVPTPSYTQPESSNGPRAFAKTGLGSGPTHQIPALRALSINLGLFL